MASDRTHAAVDDGLRLPETLEEDGILVGWSLEHEHRRQPIGFKFGDRRHPPRSGYLDPILLQGEGHLITIAPTGAGKGTGAIIPTLLRYPGPVIVIDPKGENVAVTAERRRALGQRVITLDPFGITDEPGASLNPLDLIRGDTTALVDDAARLAELLVLERGEAKDLFWINRAAQALTGLFVHLASDVVASETHLESARQLANGYDEKGFRFVRNLAASRNPDARALANTLALPAEVTAGGIAAFMQEALEVTRGENLRKALCSSSFDLDDVTRGAPLSIFIVIPPDKLESHARLLRLWIGVLITAIMRRRGPPPDRTLFILDEAAQLGRLPQLRQAITLLRGYGLQTWSFWQDVSQLRLLYPHDWQTMINNSKVVQCFGASNMLAAEAMAGLVGFADPNAVLDLDVDEMLLLIAGDEAVIAQRPNYLSDPCFRGAFATNPLYDPTRDIMPAPQRMKRPYHRPAKPGSSDEERERPERPAVTGDEIDNLLALWREREE